MASFGSKLHVSGLDETGIEKTLGRMCGTDQSFEKTDTSLEDVFIHLMGKDEK